MAQSQTTHRQTLERLILGSKVTNEKVGMWLAFISGIVIASLGFLLIYNNKNIPAGYFMILAPILTGGASYYFSKKNERSKLNEKEKQIASQKE